MKKRYDVIIIGGGVIGCTLAYFLSRASIDVALIEKGDIASGTSSGCDGNILISDKQPGVDTFLTRESQKLFEQLSFDLPYDFEYMQRGSLLTIESKEEMEIANSFVEQQKKDGYPFRIISLDTLKAQEPHVADDLLGAVEIDCDSAVNPMLFSFATAKKAGENGVDILKDCSVRNINLGKSGGVKEVVTDLGTFRTEKVVNCAGVWAPEIGKMVGINIPIKPRQGQLLVTETTFQVVKRKVMEFGYMMAKFGSGEYKRDVSPDLEKLGIAMVIEPTMSGNFLLGSSRAFVGFNKTISIEVMQGIVRRMVRFFPALRTVNIIRAYAGLRPYVEDHLPIVSAVDRVPGFFIAAGHEGDGIGLAPITGRIMQELLLDKEPPVPFEHLSFSRFK